MFIPLSLYFLVFVKSDLTKDRFLIPVRTDVWVTGIFLEIILCHIPVTLNKDEKYFGKYFNIFEQDTVLVSSVIWELWSFMWPTAVVDGSSSSVLNFPPSRNTVIHVPITLRKLKLQVLKYSVILQCLLMICVHNGLAGPHMWWAWMFLGRSWVQKGVCSSWST